MAMADNYVGRRVGAPYFFGLQYWDRWKQPQPERWYKNMGELRKFVKDHADKEQWPF